jgi:hypothetical protein
MFKIGAAVAAAFFLAAASAAPANPPSAPVVAMSSPATERDGQHDFDFLFGSWKGHHRRLRHALSGAHEWYEFDGTLVVHRVWGGLANMDESVWNLPSGRRLFVGLRLYNRKTREWSIYGGSDAGGELQMPPTVGKFDEHGVGRFYDHEIFEGKPIVARFTWTHLTAATAHWEQAFSPDDGKTWETNWIMEFTRTG